MADVEDAEKIVTETTATTTENKDDVEKATADENIKQDTSSLPKSSESSSNPASDARALLANLISLVQSIETETGEPDHKKVVYEVFGTVCVQNLRVYITWYLDKSYSKLAISLPDIKEQLIVTLVLKLRCNCYIYGLWHIYFYSLSVEALIWKSISP